MNHLSSAPLTVPRAVASVLAGLFPTLPVTATADTAAIAAPCVTLDAEGGMESPHPRLGVLTLMLRTRYRPDMDSPEEVADWHATACGLVVDRAGSIGASLAAAGLRLRSLRPADASHDLGGEDRQCQLRQAFRVELEAIV